MAVSGFLFISWRIFQLVLLIPIVGMLSWFVHGYVESNQLTPNFILVLFIVSVLALAWCFATLFNYLRARHDAFFVALIDLGFVGALIGGIVTLRGISNANCSSFSSGSLYFDLGPFGYYGRQSDSPWSVNVNKTCAMLKASWALAIIATLTFFVTFVSFDIYLGKNHPQQNSSLTFSSSAPRPPRPPQPQKRRQSSRQARIPHFPPQPPPLSQSQPWYQPWRQSFALRRPPPTQLGWRQEPVESPPVLRLGRRRRMHESEKKTQSHEKKNGRISFFGHLVSGMRRLSLDAPSCIKTTQIPPTSLPA
jgi:hypothetical protein